MTSLNVDKQIYNGLMNYDADSKMFPDLASAEPEQPDDLTYIFKLKEGVQFHKGYGEMTAEDVVYTYDTIRGAVETGQSFFLSLWLKPLAKVEAVDKYTVKFTMAEPYPDFLDTSTMCKIVSKKAAEEFGKDFARNPVGTGPFEFVEWIKDDHILLKKNEAYFTAGVPKLDEVYFQIIPDDTVKVTNLITSQVDMMKEIPPRNLEQLKGAPGVVVGQVPGTQTEQVYFNTKAGPFQDVNLRRAVAYGIDRKAIADKVFYGMAQVAYAPTPGWQLPAGDYPADMVKIGYDPDMAKKYLKASSKPDNFEFTCMTTAQGWFVEQLTVIQANLADIGIKMNIEPLEKSVMFGKMRVWDYEASYEDLNAGYFGFSAATAPLFYTPPTRQLGWGDEHGLKAFDLLNKFLVTVNAEERQIVYGDFLKILHDQVPYTQVVYVDSTDAWSESVTGYKTGTPNDSMFWETDLS
ncbi:MAG: ABC transporter substrate-binding protein [Thalassobaculaceae bacterium]|nr:ABC transporter substrate-binding protein [Thalassobaculaceae bacterium]